MVQRRRKKDDRRFPASKKRRVDLDALATLSPSERIADSDASATRSTCDSDRDKKRSSSKITKKKTAKVKKSTAKYGGTSGISAWSGVGNRDGGIKGATPPPGQRRSSETTSSTGTLDGVLLHLESQVSLVEKFVRGKVGGKSGSGL